jgi:TetR/AcrR family transcriptional regulator
MMTEKESTQKRILEAALQEFSAKGFGGARMDAISKAAGVNKAMLFYHFTSKENLYRTIVHDVLTRYFHEIHDLLATVATPEELLCAFPQVVIGFFSRRPDFVRMIGNELLNSPGNVSDVIRLIMDEQKIDLRKHLIRRISEWNREELISEPDPVQFMMNVISLCLGTFLFAPLAGRILGESLNTEKGFYERRVVSVINILKNGMLK